LLDNGSVSTFPWQRIDVVTDELFEVAFYIRFAPRYKRRTDWPTESQSQIAVVIKCSAVAC
jgi:hypothetical protein